MGEGREIYTHTKRQNDIPCPAQREGTTLYIQTAPSYLSNVFNTFSVHTLPNSSNHVVIYCKYLSSSYQTIVDLLLDVSILGGLFSNS